MALLVGSELAAPRDDQALMMGLVSLLHELFDGQLSHWLGLDRYVASNSQTHCLETELLLHMELLGEESPITIELQRKHQLIPFVL